MKSQLHIASTPRKMLEFGGLDLSPLDRFGQTPLDDAIRHEHVAVQRRELIRSKLASKLETAWVVRGTPRNYLQAPTLKWPVETIPKWPSNASQAAESRGCANGQS